MSKTKELLIACKKKIGVDTDYKLAKALKIHSGRIADYINGKRIPDENACLRIAMLLERNPIEIIAIIQADTEKNIQRKAFWNEVLKRAKKLDKQVDNFLQTDLKEIDAKLDHLFQSDVKDLMPKTKKGDSTR
jgi:transcriptional regulator with XRE-family HTH domain